MEEVLQIERERQREKMEFEQWKMEFQESHKVSGFIHVNPYAGGG